MTLVAPETANTKPNQTAPPPPYPSGLSFRPGLIGRDSFKHWALPQGRLCGPALPHTPTPTPLDYAPPSISGGHTLGLAHPGPLCLQVVGHGRSEACNLLATTGKRGCVQCGPVVGGC